ncbi:CDP-diacylglycerol--inositol 3-phosphatidyltransferase-like [Ruditapes philippinarum]|uniref:CDP-diacylglycerol--inositol 3-phosphatidyltransferase-like n=1 Tax=Ruditapes philippinarum TaxID=129788 RepID=UPI00295AB33E|nr:CDP-diacylglycerol--inositol 3-phosphatidyltransferase-like [Ruditapes philippinarum]
MAIKCEDADEKTGYKGYFNTDNVFLFVPNIIDYIRVAFLAYFVYNASIGNYNVACICYVVSVSLDELDGNSARYFNQKV